MAMNWSSLLVLGQEAVEKSGWRALQVRGEFEPLSSSNLDAYRYDPGSETLWIEFHGGRIYRYDSVPQSIADGLGTAGSPGGYFHSAIKGSYNYHRE
jgi:hypothetical protein